MEDESPHSRGGLFAFHLRLLRPITIYMTKELVCTQCGTIGTGKTLTKGSIIIEFILWLCFIIPGLIYSIWRMTSRVKVCKVCESASLIPVDSPSGKKVIAAHTA
jgi:hypothetical protein